MNNTVEKIVEKWHGLFLKTHAIEEAMNANIHPPTRDATNVTVGPPAWLTPIEKARWHHQLRMTLEKCVACIQLPAQKAALSRLWVELNDTVINSKNVAEVENIGHRINRGLRRGVSKLLEKYTTVNNNNNNKNKNSRSVRQNGKEMGRNDRNRNKSKDITVTIPPPPLTPQLNLICAATRTDTSSPPSKHPKSGIEELEIEAPPFRELLRGEEFTPLCNYFEIYQALVPSKDIATIIAFGIFGSKKKTNFLYRSLHKHMQWHEETERKTFKPGYYATREGENKYTRNWGNWKEVVQKRKCKLTRKQITVIAELYQLQIRFFRFGKEKRPKFVCVDQTAFLQHRVINILEMEGGYWTILQGTITPVLKFDSREGKYDMDFYLAGCSIEKKGEVHNHNIGKVNVEGSESIKVQSEVQGQSNIFRITESEERLYQEIDYHLLPRDRSFSEISDTTSSNLLSPASIERRLEAEREESLEVNNVVCEKKVDTDKKTDKQLQAEREDNLEVNITIVESTGDGEEEIERLFPTELIITKPKKKKISKREVWQKWRNVVRNKNKVALKKYAAEIAREENRKESHKSVFDYTTGRLTESEIDILSKGESFCPTTHKIDLDRLKTDIYYYNRKLRLHEQFKDKQLAERDVEQRKGKSVVNTNRRSRISVRESTNRNTTRTTLINNNTNNNSRQRQLPSTYDPLTQNRNLNRYTSCIQEDCLLAVKSEINIKDNIHKQHRIALKTLKQKIESKTIMITKADKGSGIVVCDYDIYIQKGTKYIEEEAKAYSKVEDTEIELVTKLTKQRDKVVERLRKENVIPVQTATYCMKQIEEKITGMKFYFKIHKDQNVATTPVRPLQSCIAAPTHHLSLVLTDILQPLLNTKNIPSFIYDSNHLLFRLQTLGAIPNNCTIISSDVSALYPSIPHQQGLEATHSFLSKYTQYNSSQIDSLMQALKIVISQNYVMWNNSIYKQISGVAMGTPVAVAYANIFMAWVDEKVKQQAHYIHEHIRFIDDNLFIIPEEKIEELMQLANSILPSIKYTHEKLDKNSNKGLAFLDTQLYISEEGLIEARLYTKPTDRHAYLLPSSYHPPHIVRNILSAVFKRLKRLCSRTEWFLEDAEKAKGWLKNRGYKSIEVDKALNSVVNLDRWEMIVKIEANRGIAKASAEDMYKIPFIVTYSKYAKSLKQVLVKRQDLLNNSYKRSKVQPRITFRRQRNLDDLLIQKSLRGPIRTLDQEGNKFVHCGEKQQYRGICPCKEKHEVGLCRCCAHAELQPIDSKVNLNKRVDCNTKNVIYLIGCKKCSKQYVGETQQTVRDRLGQHLSNISKLNQPLYLHFRLVHAPSNLFITILETVRSTEQFFRKIRESWWINHLQTLEPKGFNAKLDCNQIYQENLRM